jgi:hypothetical protein
MDQGYFYVIMENKSPDKTLNITITFNNIDNIILLTPTLDAAGKAFICNVGPG